MLYVYVIACLSALGGLLFGYDTGVISGAIIYIKEDFQFSPFLEGFVVSALLLGAMVGALSAGKLSDRFGRRKIILLAAVVFGIGALAAGLSPNVIFLVASRIVLGLAVGLASVIVPLYISEMAPPNIRGRLVTLNQLAITVGILVSYFINYLLADSGQWRLMLGLAVIPAAILFVGMLFVPESPRWMISQNLTDRARKVLARVRGTNDIEGEMQDIKEAHENEKQGKGMKELFKPWARPVLIVGVLLSFLGQASGVNVIVYFAPSILKSSGFADSASLLATVGVGTINVLMTIVGMSIVDKVGRKPLLISGLVGMFVSLVVLGMMDLFPGFSGSSIVEVLCLFVYMASNAVGVGVIIFLLPSEIFPMRIRGAAMSISLLFNWGTNFVVSTTFLSLLNMMGHALTFWMYALICVLFIAFAYFMIPETKGRSLEEIEKELRGRTKTRKTS